MVGKFRNFKKLNEELDRYEPAVETIRQDFLKQFTTSLKKFKIEPNSIEELFDEIQEEFDKGEEPKPWLIYKDDSREEISPKVSGTPIGVFESYGPAHAEIRAAIELNIFDIVTTESYNCVQITEQFVQKKVKDLQDKIAIWEIQ